MIIEADAKDLTIYAPIGEGGQLSGFDEKLIEMATRRLTAEQMYEALGNPPSMTPARCFQRVREILKAQTRFSALEQQALLLNDFVKLRDVLWERIEGTETKITKNGDVIEVESGVGYFNAMARVLREWSRLMTEMQKNVDDGATTITQQDATLMMQVISIMFDRYHGMLEREGVKLPDANRRREMFEEIMPLGFQVLQERVA